MRDMIKNNDGFSLIEVMVAVVILALVTLPIVNYFTYSSLRAIDGRDKQTANELAEDIIDNVRGYNHYKEIETNLVAMSAPAGFPTMAPGATPGVREQIYYGWEEDTNPIHTPASAVTTANPPVRLKKNVDIAYNDGLSNEFVAKMYVDFTAYKGDTLNVKGLAIDNAKYNDYAIPRPVEVYSETNIVAAEDDEKDQAVGYIYTQMKGKAPATAAPYDDSDSNIEEPVNDYHGSGLGAGGVDTAYTYIIDNLRRTMCINVSYEDETTKDNYVVKIYYHYMLTAADGSEYEKDVILTRSTIAKEDLKNIYLFYGLVNDTNSTENVFVSVGSSILESDIKDIGIYIVCQEMEEVANLTVAGKISNYKLNLVAAEDGVAAVPSSSLAKKFKYFTNVDITMSTNFTNLDSLVPKDSVPARRIGKVYVDIFSSKDTTFSDPISHMETTIAE